VPKKILVGVDMSKLGEDVTLYGLSLAYRLDVDVTFIHVLPHPSLWRGYDPWIPRIEIDHQIKEIAQKRLTYYLKKAEEKDPVLKDKKREIVVLEGNPAETIINYAKEKGYNLIIVGSRGHSAFERIVVGSTATNVARYAHCSVLIHRIGEDII